MKRGEREAREVIKVSYFSERARPVWKTMLYFQHLVLVQYSVPYQVLPEKDRMGLKP